MLGSDTRVRGAKPRERACKLYDERDLFLLVTPTGGRVWRLKYVLHGREKLISLGAYPDVGLKRAREKRDEAGKLLVDGIDPSVERQERRAKLLETFGGVAEEWLKLQSKSLASETISIVSACLNSALYPYLGGKPVAAVTAQELLGALRRIEARGRFETAHRVRALAGRVLRYSRHGTCAARRGSGSPVRSRNFASVTDPVRVGELMRAVDGYTGHPVTALAQ